MDVLTHAADAVFVYDLEEAPGGRPLQHTPSKRSREVLSEVTHTINISPEKLHNSPLHSLFTAPTVNPGTAKRQGSSLITSVATSSASSKSFLYSTPSPGRDKVAGRSPLTPTSNLKLLTRIATMEESFTSKKELFCNKGSANTSESPSVLVSHVQPANPRQKQKLQRYKSDSLSTSQADKKSSMAGGRKSLKKHCSTDNASPVTEAVGHLPPLDDIITRPTEGSRKDKSLGLLSEKFLEHFPMEISFLETPRRMVIDEVATVLGTERRRVYDIINVLESLNMAARVQKNMYQWMGKLYLEETLGRLKAIAIKLNLRAQVQALHATEAEKNFKVPQWIKTNWNSEGVKVDSRREKSLGILCQKFLMLLLVSPEPYLLSLDDALKMLMGDVCDDNDRLRTRGRRLYDIANVLTSLGLVQRIPLAKGFRYIGPEVEAIPNEEDTGLRLRHSLLPSCLWAGDSGGKENMTCPGDHEVTPSAAPPPAQKRGRPRKLSTDFSASTIPAAKRTRLQRTRSEDISMGKQSRRITRHPSLHDICQVAEVEREKLLQKEQQQQQKIHIILKSVPVPSKKEGAPTFHNPGFASTSAASAPTLTTILHQKHFPTRTKIPVALTFKKYDENHGKDAHTLRPVNLVQRVPSASGVNIRNNVAQVRTPSHSLQAEQGRSSAFLAPGVSKGVTYLTSPTQPVNKIHLENRSQDAPTVPLAPPKEPQNTRSVIRVVTSRGGIQYHQESSKVFTVLPTSQTQSPSMPQYHQESSKVFTVLPTSQTQSPSMPQYHQESSKVFTVLPTTQTQSPSMPQYHQESSKVFTVLPTTQTQSPSMPQYHQESSKVFTVLPTSQTQSPSLPQYHQESSKVFTVLPTSQKSPSLPVARQYVLQGGGRLQTVPIRRDAHSQPPAMSASHSQGAKGVGLEHEHSKPSTYTVYTISGAHLPSTSSTNPHNMVLPIVRERPSLPADCVPASKPPVIYTWADSMSVTSSRSDGPTGGQQINTCHLSHVSPSNCLTPREQARAEWQPPSDTSSTDSELEEIFGDCFRFTRPKVLVVGNASQDGTDNDML